MNQWESLRPYAIKAASIVCIAILLVLPLEMVRDLIEERSTRRDHVDGEIEKVWGRDPLLVGPLLHVPLESETNGDGIILLPDQIKTIVSVDVEMRRRAIFYFPVYRSQIRIDGRFLAEQAISLESHSLDWTRSKLLVGLDGLGTVQGAIDLTWNGMTHELQPGDLGSDLLPSNVQSDVEFGPDQGADFAIDLQVAGSKSMMIHPSGRHSTIDVESNWPYPSFTGSFLPTRHQIDDAGFKAHWSVGQVARALPQSWRVGKVGRQRIAKGMLGMAFMPSIPIYQIVDRSLKYAMLFICLTFLGFLLVEITVRLRIHPVQYTFVGLALSVFYLLLLSLSEHMHFRLAYAVSASATTSLITVYAASALGASKRALIFGATLGGIYAVLYAVLVAVHYALLLGSLTVFLALAVAMWITRKTDWYQLGTPTAPPPPLAR